MTQNAFDRAQISEDIKNQAAEVLADAETREAIDELKSGRGIKSKNADGLFKDLGLD